MKIIFVLDLIPVRPMGGVKIIFKYANHFAEMGYDVKIVFKSDFLSSIKKVVPYNCRKIIVQAYLTKGPTWFALDRRVKRVCIDNIDDRCIPNADAIFATAVTTAESVAYLSEKKGEKYYLVQDYENWARGDKYVDYTYSLGMHNISIADWLYDKILSVTGERPDLIRNPIDTEKFVIYKKPEERKAHSIAMICQMDERKGFVYGLEAIIKIKSLFPDTQCTIFGISKRPNIIPKWIKYKKNATEKKVIDIYNNAAVFLCSSISEGYGLCGAESMACGCALISTNYEGVKSYAKDGYNALLSPIKNVDMLVENIKQLFLDDNKRCEIAQNGNLSIQKTSWKKAFLQMDKIILKKENDYE